MLAVILSTAWLGAGLVGQSSAPAAGAPPMRTVSVKIEASETDGKLLLQKLIHLGMEHKLKIEPGEDSFAYRIVFSLEQAEDWWLPKPRKSTKTNTYSLAKVKVYDNAGLKLFEFKKSMSKTDQGAANAAAKEIIKRILKSGKPPKS